MAIENSFMNKSYTAKINSAPLQSRTLIKVVEVVENLQLHHPQKNIPVPSGKSYKLHLMDKIDQVMKGIRWKAFFYMNRSEDNTQETAWKR